MVDPGSPSSVACGNQRGEVGGPHHTPARCSAQEDLKGTAAQKPQIRKF